VYEAALTDETARTAIKALISAVVMPENMYLITNVPMPRNVIETLGQFFSKLNEY
jgi:hypothetical protein